MNVITIRVPMWSSRSIGILPRKITPGLNRIEITYIDSSGDRLFPDPFFATSEFLKSYPRNPFRTKNGIKKFLVIPIRDLEELDEKGEVA